MKSTIGRKILAVILVPFSILFGILLVIIAYSVTQYVVSWSELELRGISEINAADLSGRIYSVRISVLSAADSLDLLDMDNPNGRVQAEGIVKAMFENAHIYNAWLACEPNAFDSRDADHTGDYPGAPSGRFLRSYVQDGQALVLAPDMDENTLDDGTLSPWYVIPRDTGALYIDIDNDIPNLYDYGLGAEPVFTLSIVAPIHKEGRVIGCVGADVQFDVTTFGIDHSKQAAVAVFYPNGRIFYSQDLAFAEESIDTLGFSDPKGIHAAFEAEQSLFLPNEYSIFLDRQAFTYFQPVSIGEGVASPFLYTAIPRSRVFSAIRAIFILIASVAAALPILVLAMYLYVKHKISKPLQSLTLAADAISQGELETEIAFFRDARGEIGVLSRSLHRMVEQFRVYILRLTQTQEEMSVFFQVGELIKSDNPARIVREIPAMLCDRFGFYRATVVYIAAGRARVLSQSDFERGLYESNIRNAPDFLYHAKITEILAGKKLVFMNEYVIFKQELRFLDSQTLSACLVPLRAEEDLLGYIILENKENACVFEARMEALLGYFAQAFSDWLKEREERDESLKPAAFAFAPARAPVPAPAGAPAASIREVEGLDVNPAIEAMGGLAEVYEQSVRLLVKLLPDTLEKMEGFLADDLRLFAIEAHGLKGSLGSVGAYALSASAAELERAAKADDAQACQAAFPAFKAALEALCEKLSDGRSTGAQKPPGDKAALAQALEKAEAAAAEYDALGAVEFLNPLADSAFEAEVQAGLDAVIQALEVFDCEKAAGEIARLKAIVRSDG